MMKADQDSPSDFADRRSDRVPVGATITQMRQQNWYSVEVTLCNVSTCGFMAECAENVRIGSHVTLDVPGVGPVDAQVRWLLGGRMGGMFLDPISLSRCQWTATKAAPGDADA